MTIGERIKKRREEIGLSQTDLAKAVGYKTRSAINKIELDGRGISQNKIVAISQALKVTPSYLMGWEEETYSDEDGIQRLVSELTAMQEETIEKFFMLTPKNQETLLGIINTLLQSQQ